MEFPKECEKARARKVLLHSIETFAGIECAITELQKVKGEASGFLQEMGNTKMT